MIQWPRDSSAYDIWHDNYREYAILYRAVRILWWKHLCFSTPADLDLNPKSVSHRLSDLRQVPYLISSHERRKNTSHTVVRSWFLLSFGTFCAWWSSSPLHLGSLLCGHSPSLLSKPSCLFPPLLTLNSPGFERRTSALGSRFVPPATSNMSTPDFHL